MSKKNIQREQIKASVKELPDGWTVCQLGDVMRLKNGYAFKSKYYRPEGIPLVRISDINDGKVTLEKAEHIPEGKANIDFIIQPGDLLIAMSGATTGKTGIYNGSQPCLQNQRVGNFKIISEYTVNKKYRNYYVASLRKEIEKAAYGGAQPNISAKGIEAFDFPLAPLNEQKRIVAEIEKQFSRLDEAVDNLKRVKTNLKRYKASVLKAAVEGKLTEEWRKSNPDVEIADKLLKRILAERRKKWEEAELAKMKASGKKPKDDKWKKKYKDPSQTDMSKLDELPNGWHWFTSDQLFWFVTSGSRGWAKYYSDSGAVFLRIGNLDHDSVSLDLNKKQFVKPPRGAEGTRTRVEGNDILISITADVGMIGVVPSGFDEAYINQHISLARPVSSVHSLYIALYLTSRLGQNQFIALQRGATKTGLGLDDIRSVNIPMPPFEEQAEIISQIEKKLSVVDEIEIEVNKNLKRASRLRQSILKRAFSGLLVQNHRSMAKHTEQCNTTDR